MFDDYSRTVSEAKHKTQSGEEVKILSPKQMLQRLPVALAQVKAGNTYKSYILCIEKKKLLKVYITI